MQLWLQSQNFPAEENKERGVKHLLKIVSMQRAAADQGRCDWFAKLHCNFYCFGQGGLNSFAVDFK